MKVVVSANSGVARILRQEQVTTMAAPNRNYDV